MLEKMLKKKEKVFDNSKKRTFKNVTPKSLKHVVRYYATCGPKKKYKKGLFQRILKTKM